MSFVPSMRRANAAASFDRWTGGWTRAREPVPRPVPPPPATRRSGARRRVRRSCADLPDRWPCVRLEGVSHGQRRVMQPGLRRPGRDPKGGGRLVEREPEIEPQDEHLAVLSRESLEASIELLARRDVL